LNTLTESATVGLDLGSSYVKAVVVDRHSRIIARGCCRTGYDYQRGIKVLLEKFPKKVAATGVTGYGRGEWPSDVLKTEISCMARGCRELDLGDCCLVDIGGQDCKALLIRDGKAAHHALNRRCAAGTGSYLEFLGYRLGLEHEELVRLASSTRECHPLNSFCTVFASTEIIDCMRNRVPLPELIRGMYASVAARARELMALTEPLYLSGGVIEHHPVLADVFRQVLEIEAHVVPNPQYLAAYGAALYAKDLIDAK
jgi:predicted CoA-substrate-specific enzyme activase